MQLGEDEKFTRTAPAAYSQDWILRQPAYCVMLLLHQLQEPSAVLQLDGVLVGLALRCACQIALDFRRHEAGSMNAQLIRASSFGSPRGLQKLRRSSAPSLLEDVQPAAAWAAVLNSVDSDVPQQLDKRLRYIIDSHVEDVGVVTDRASQSVAFHGPAAPQSEEGAASSQLGTYTDVSTDGVPTISGTTTALEEQHVETPCSTSKPKTRESTPIPVPLPASLFRPGARLADTFVDTQFGSTQESQLSAPSEPEKSDEGNRMTLTAADIERWIDGSSVSGFLPRVPSVPNIPSEPQSQSLPSRISALHSNSKVLSRASVTSAKSSGTPGGEKLLRSSMHAVQELERMMMSHEYLLMIQLAGVSGVCRALVKSLTKLKDSLPEEKVGVLLLEAPRTSAGVTRMIHQSGFPVLPPLSNRRGSMCMWSTLFSSSRVPRAMVIKSSSAAIVCGDAIRCVHRKDVSKFPWEPPCWSTSLLESIMKASNAYIEEDVRKQAVLLLHVDRPDELPANFPRMLRMWLAMYPTTAIKCYTTGTGERLTDESGFLFLEEALTAHVRKFSESANCCMLFSPLYRHLVMAFDVAHMGPTASAWQLQDNSTRHLWRRLHTVEYARLHTTPAFIAVSFRESLDKAIEQVFAAAVEEAYDAQHTMRHSADGERVMYCFSAAQDHETPRAAYKFVRDVSSEARGVGDVCALLVVSVPDMRMSQINCSSIPTVEYVCGAVEAFFSKELTFLPLSMKQGSNA